MYLLLKSNNLENSNYATTVIVNGNSELTDKLIKDYSHESLTITKHYSLSDLIKNSQGLEIAQFTYNYEQNKCSDCKNQFLSRDGEHICDDCFTKHYSECSNCYCQRYYR